MKDMPREKLNFKIGIIGVGFLGQYLAEGLIKLEADIILSPQNLERIASLVYEFRANFVIFVRYPSTIFAKFMFFDPALSRLHRHSASKPRENQRFFANLWLPIDDFRKIHVFRPRFQPSTQAQCFKTI